MEPSICNGSYLNGSVYMRKLYDKLLRISIIILAIFALSGELLAEDKIAPSGAVVGNTAAENSIVGISVPSIKPSNTPRAWYDDPALVWSFLSAIGSVAAVIVATIAFLFAQRGQNQQILRQKREELRNVLEKLISFREELSRLSALKYDYERAFASSLLNEKRLVYLEAAENLADQLGDDVSPSEYYVIGYENMMDSDFAHGINFYRAAAKNSQKTSKTKQSEIWRSLAGAYFRNEPGVLNIEEGRKSYAKAIEVLRSSEDYYSNYVKALCYREWAASEASLRKFPESEKCLHEASRIWNQIPKFEVLQFRVEELRHIANTWRYIGVQTFQDHQGIDASILFATAIELLKDLEKIISEGSKDVVIDALGLAYQDWGQQVLIAGSPDRAREHFELARRMYENLSLQYPYRSMRIGDLPVLALSNTPDDL